MKTVTIHAYEAFDGERFEDQKECERYERDNQWRRLVGLTETEIQAALADPASEDEHTRAVASAIESVGYRISRAKRVRKAAGNGNGEDKGEDKSDEPPAPPPEAEPEAPTAA